MSPWLHSLSWGCVAALLVSAMLTIYRMKLGPTPVDRTIALDTLVVCFMGIIGIVCIVQDTTLYFDAVWILSLVGFLGSAAIAKYLERGRIF